MLNYPWVIQISQIGIVLFELMSPIVFFVNDRLRAWVIAYFYLFHLVTWLAITISFAPHLVAMGSFLKLEKLRPGEWAKASADLVSLRLRERAGGSAAR